MISKSIKNVNKHQNASKCTKKHQKHQNRVLTWSNVIKNGMFHDNLSLLKFFSKSESLFQVINQAVDDHTRDNTLFAINSKRASPVEVAAEALEVEVLSNDLNKASNAAVTGNVEPPRDGVVSQFEFSRLFQNSKIFADICGNFSRGSLRIGSAICGKSGLHQSPSSLFEWRRVSRHLLGRISGNFQSFFFGPLMFIFGGK